MTLHRLQGFRPTPLASYLAALGLVRVLAQQADPLLRCWWEGDAMVLETEVSDLGGWLVNDYAPTPVLSPWNGGSGFGAKDKTSKVALEALVATADPRLDGFRASYEAVIRVVKRQSVGLDMGKPTLVRRLRNEAPDAMLEWLDAAVLVLADSLAFPPLLGTGGNDGRLDFSTNFHQRLLELLAPEGVKRSRSVAWASDLVSGEAVTPLARSTSGQFDPFASGGKSSGSFGEGVSLNNPWQAVLMVEGSMVFASGATRRLSAEGSSRAAMPFTVLASEAGSGSSSTSEASNSRGEVWVPIWDQPLAYSEVRQLFREARAHWRGHPATRAAHMYEAVRSGGVSRGVNRFVRFGFHQRNGLAFVATALDSVAVDVDPAVRLLGPIERWLEGIGRGSAIVNSDLNRARRLQVEFARRPSSDVLLDLLSTITRLQLSHTASPAATAFVRPLRLPSGSVMQFLADRNDLSTEVRLAAGLASRQIAGTADGRRLLAEVILPMRVHKHGSGPEVQTSWSEVKVRGLAQRPLTEIIGEAITWAGSHRLHGVDSPVISGVMPVQPIARFTHPEDASRWVSGEVNEAHLEKSFFAMLSLGWDMPDSWTWSKPTRADAFPIHPDVAVMAALAAGLKPASEGLGGTSTQVRAWRSDWVARLAAGRTEQVLVEARRVCAQAGWPIDTRQRTNFGRGADGPTLLAASLCGVRGGRSLVRPLVTIETESFV